MTGDDVVELAKAKIGQEYVYGARVPLDDKNWPGPWDCAEYCSWAVYQASNRIYGCTNNNSSPASADAWTGSWKRDALSLGRKIDANAARFIPGAMLLRRGRSSGHIVISDGSGNGTLEARGRRYGVVRHVVLGRVWDMGVLVPWITYDETELAPGIAALEIPFTYRTHEEGVQRGNAIGELQETLIGLGFLTGTPSSNFDANTEIAVRDYQISVGLTPDGQVDIETAAELGIQLDPQVELVK